jgi:hypothetical protein
MLHKIYRIYALCPYIVHLQAPVSIGSTGDGMSPLNQTLFAEHIKGTPSEIIVPARCLPANDQVFKNQ